jgi:tetratricopeptide (TPR) repeat protein
MALMCVAAYANAPESTPAQIAIRKAQEQIARYPDHYRGYNELAMAYARRARETSDVAFYAKAQETLRRSFALAPANFDGLKVETWLQLGNHEFAKARESATALNRKMPDDVTVYAYLADATVELGNYAEAVRAVDWMLKLRPGNVAALTRAGYLRELHGDIEGAVEVMQMAYDSTPYQQVEDRAWILTQLSHLALLAGNVPVAERQANAALALFPQYHYALAALARVRTAQKKFDEAASLLHTRSQAAGHAENLYEEAMALRAAGREPDAARAGGGRTQEGCVHSRGVRVGVGGIGRLSDCSRGDEEGAGDRREGPGDAVACRGDCGADGTE